MPCIAEEEARYGGRRLRCFQPGKQATTGSEPGARSNGRHEGFIIALKVKPGSNLIQTLSERPMEFAGHD
jgi:hypothetical protein